MRRIIVLFLSVFLALFPASADSPRSVPLESDAPGQPERQQGRIIVLVVDVSQSIRRQLGDIIRGLSEEIVEKRLRPLDYCVVVPLGDRSVVESADSFGVRFSRDKEKILSYLSNIGARMPTNLNTDIGAAMAKTFDFISMIDAETNGGTCEPLVLFITDGEIYESPNSSERVELKTPEAIFADPRTDPALHSYSNWWFLGIENEGVPLSHIRSIAEGAGAADRYETLSDMEQFGVLFDSWLASIPDPLPRDRGGVEFGAVSLGGSVLSSDGSVFTVVPSGERKFSWTMTNTFSRTPVVLRLKDVSATFQDAATGAVTQIPLRAEAGNIELSPGGSRVTEAVAEFPGVSGRGRLKMSFSVESRGGSAGEIPECSLFVEFVPPLLLLARRVAVPVAAAVLVAVVLLLVRLVRSRASVRVQMEVVGRPRGARAVAMRVGRRADIGSKPGADFRLDVGFPPVAATLERTGASSWRLVPKDAQAMAGNPALDPYRLGTAVKVSARDGSSVTVKFRARR